VHCVQFTAAFRRTHCAFNYYSRKSSYYAGIIGNAFANLLRSKLCRHNWRKSNSYTSTLKKLYISTGVGTIIVDRKKVLKQAGVVHNIKSQ